MTLGGRVRTKSNGGVHGMGGRNDVVDRSVRSMVAEGNTSWGRMSGSEMMVVIRAGFCCWSREFAISILQIFTPR